MIKGAKFVDPGEEIGHQENSPNNLKFFTQYKNLIRIVDGIRISENVKH